jgi:hypothetical protein
LEELNELRIANNDVFRNVWHTREAALDADNNLRLATKTVQNAEHLGEVRLVVRIPNRVGQCKSIGADRGGVRSHLLIRVFLFSVLPCTFLSFSRSRPLIR